MQNSQACFTGHQPYRFTWECDEGNDSYAKLGRFLVTEILSAIAKGYKTFYTGGARGVDLLAGELVVNLKPFFKGLRLIAVVPYREQSSGWTSFERTLYNRLLNECDEQIIMQELKSDDCYKRRNQYMIDHSSLLIAAYNQEKSGSGQTYRMAMHRKMDIIHMNTETFIVVKYKGNCLKDTYLQK